MSRGRHHRSLAPSARSLGVLGRHLGALAAVAAMVAGLTAPSAVAQVPTLPTFPGDPNAPSTSTPPSSPPRGSTTTTTVIPPLLPNETPLPAPENAAPPPSVLTPITTVPARRTTTFKPPPIPPSTPPRALPVTRARPAGSSAVPGTGAPADDEGGFAEELPFSRDGDGGGVAAGPDVLELGAEASERELVGSLASVAAGLIATVLLGVAWWLRREVRRAPAAGPPLPEPLSW